MTGSDSAAKPIPLRRPRKCPICGQPSDRSAYPFCSRRCADIDLNHWLSGRYVIPATESEDEADDADSADGKADPAS